LLSPSLSGVKARYLARNVQDGIDIWLFCSIITIRIKKYSPSLPSSQTVVSVGGGDKETLRANLFRGERVGSVICIVRQCHICHCEPPKAAKPSHYAEKRDGFVAEFILSPVLSPVEGLSKGSLAMTFSPKTEGYSHDKNLLYVERRRNF
jgi:hypothetical protein